MEMVWSIQYLHQWRFNCVKDWNGPKVLPKWLVEQYIEFKYRYTLIFVAITLVKEKY